MLLCALRLGQSPPLSSNPPVPRRHPLFSFLTFNSSFFVFFACCYYPFYLQRHVPPCTLSSPPTCTKSGQQKELRKGSCVTRVRRDPISLKTHSLLSRFVSFETGQLNQFTACLTIGLPLAPRSNIHRVPNPFQQRSRGPQHLPWKATTQSRDYRYNTGGNGSITNPKAGEG